MIKKLYEKIYRILDRFVSFLEIWAIARLIDKQVKATVFREY